MRETQRLKQLEEDLLSGNLERISLDYLQQLLGEHAVHGLQQLREMVLLLTQAGYVGTRESRVRLSAKGVRKIGQLALRDIFQGLLRDRTGGHQSDHRGASEVRLHGTKPHVFGEPLHPALVRTPKRA